MRPVDLVDILIVAWVIYRLLILLRGTRGVILLRGFVFLLVAAALSGWLRLRTVNWLLERSLTALLVALPVVFYPEIRRALERLGRGDLFAWNGQGLGRSPGNGEDGGTSPGAGAGTGASTGAGTGRAAALGRSLHGLYRWLWGHSPPEADRERLIDVVVRAAGELSRRGFGALIAIEQEVGLGEHLETGVRLEARLSVELLVNLFTPGTPLHDGAVIIRNGRVAAAACFLPLARPERLERKMGSRHRAALGLAEESDALVIVVSEETRRISGARDGLIYWDLGEEGLRHWLNEALGVPLPEKESPAREMGAGR
ncbi:MAG TPA: diadenylate cyclase [Firmicutes bacterium]|nr:diadenylate cyclase [Bacillota bacterium]